MNICKKYETPNQGNSLRQWESRLIALNQTNQ